MEPYHTPSIPGAILPRSTYWYLKHTLHFISSYRWHECAPSRLQKAILRQTDIMSLLYKDLHALKVVLPFVVKGSRFPCQAL